MTLQTVIAAAVFGMAVRMLLHWRWPHPHRATAVTRYLGDLTVMLVIALLLQAFLLLTQISTAAFGALLGMLSALGFTVATGASRIWWEGVTWKGWAIDAVGWLVALSAMGAIIAVG